MDYRYRPDGDISLSEDTVRILMAGGQTFDVDEEKDDEGPVFDDFGEVHAGLIFNNCFRCGLGGHRAINCTMYTTMCRSNCQKCRQKNISLAHMAEDCKGHCTGRFQETGNSV